MADGHEEDFLESDEGDLLEFGGLGVEEPSDHMAQLELVKKMLNDNIHVDLESYEARTEFFLRYRHLFMGGKEGTLLHVALQFCNHDYDRRILSLHPLFKLVVNEYPDILQARNSLGFTVLHFAIEMHLVPVAKYLCELAPSKAAASAIGCSGPEGGNCLHAVIRHGRHMDVMAYFISLCEVRAVLDRDDLGRTPLHYAVCLEDPSAPRASRAKPQHGFHRHPRIKPTAKSTEGVQLNDPDDNENSSNSATTDRLTIIHLLIQKGSRALLEADRDGDTPYQARTRQLLKVNTMILTSQPDGTRKGQTGASEPRQNGLSNFEMLVSTDPMTSLIREHCLRCFSREEVIKCLYKPGYEREITFDLVGLQHPVISKDYLVQLTKHSRFESVLQYVRLPRLTIETSESYPGLETRYPATLGQSRFARYPDHH
jgi:hypothetical protein